MIFKKNITIITIILWVCPVLVLGQESEKLESYIQEILGSDLKIEMQAIPAGEFSMGSPADETHRQEDEGPVHSVKIDGFWMSKYEITWDLYYLFLEREIDKINDPKKGNDVDFDVDAISGATVPYVDMSLGMGTGEGLPVGNVTHLAASKFCKWLSAKTGNFYRLPTEAEWEYAARAGSQSTYHFGDDPGELNEYGWYYENSGGSYKQVGSKMPNNWGLYDMHGNVAEWTLDTYSANAYTNREKNTLNPVVITGEEYPHSVRGGSYYDDPEYLRSAARLGSTENWKMRDPQFPKSKWWHTDAPYVGFRIVRVPSSPAESEYIKYWGPEIP